MQLALERPQQVDGEKVNTFGNEMLFEDDPIWGASPRDLARVWVIALLHARYENASALIIDHPNSALFLEVKGEQYELVPPPAPFFLDAVRMLMKAAGVTPSRSGAVRLPSGNGVERLEIAYERKPAPRVRVTGFGREESVSG